MGDIVSVSPEQCSESFIVKEEVGLFCLNYITFVNLFDVCQTYKNVRDLKKVDKVAWIFCRGRGIIADAVSRALLLIACIFVLHNIRNK